MFNLGTLLLILQTQNNISPVIRTLGYEVTLLGRGMREAGAILTAGLTVPIVGIVKASTELSATFETITTKLTSLAGVAEGELEGVRKSLLDLAPIVGIGPEALAEGMIKASSTTRDTKVALEILTTAAYASAAGMGKTVDIVTALSAVVNSYGSSNITAAQAADVLTKAVQDGGAEAKQLAPVLANIVPFAAQMGISFQEVAANFATVTKLGVPAGEAITMLTSVMAAMTRENSKGRETLASLNGTIYQSIATYAGLRNEVETKGLAATLLKLSEAFKGNEEKIFSVTSRIEGFKNVMAVAGAQADTYAEELTRMTVAYEQSGTLMGAFNAMSQTQNFLWSQLTAQAQVIGVAIGDGLAPAIRALLQTLQPTLKIVLELAQAFANSNDVVKTIIVTLAGLAAVVGPVLIIFGQLFMAIGNISRAMPIITAFYNSLNLSLMAIATSSGPGAATAMGLLTISQNANTTSLGILSGALSFYRTLLLTAALELSTWTAKVGIATAAQYIDATATGVMTAAKALLSAAITYLNGNFIVMGVRMALATAASYASATASGVAAAGLYILGTAVTVVSGAFSILSAVATPLITGIVAWKFGPAIAEWIGLTDAIKRASIELQYYRGLINDKERKDALTLLSAESKQMWEENAQGIKNSADSVKRLKDELSGANLNAALVQLHNAFLDLKEGGLLTEDSLKRVANAAGALKQQGAILTPELQGVWEANEKLNKSIDTGIEIMDKNKKSIKIVEDFEEAMQNLRDTGDGWRQTIKQMDPVLLETISSILKAGYSVEDLNKVFREVDVKAVVAKLKDVETQDNKTAQATFELTKRLSEINELINGYGSEFNKASAAIDDWATKTIAGYDKAKFSAKEYSDLLTATRNEAAIKHGLLIANTIEADELSQRHYIKLVRDAQEAYDKVTRFDGEFDAKVIQNRYDELQVAKDNLINWEKQVEKSLNKIVESNKSAVVMINGLWQQATVGNVTINGKDFENPIVNKAVVAANPSTNPSGFASVINPPPARASGGPVYSDSSYLVGEMGPEIFRPQSSGMITPNNSSSGKNVSVTIASGAISFQYPIMNDPRSVNEIATLVGDEVVKRILLAGGRV